MSIAIWKFNKIFFRSLEERIKQRNRKRAEIWALKSFRDRSVKGLEDLIRTIGKVRRQLNRGLSIEGILITMVDRRTTYARDITELIHDTYGSQIRIFTHNIPFSVRAAEISAEGVSIFRHDPRGKVAEAYQYLTQEVLSDEE